MYTASSPPLYPATPPPPPNPPNGQGGTVLTSTGSAGVLTPKIIG